MLLMSGVLPFRSSYRKYKNPLFISFGVFFLLLFLHFSAVGQILDDSTKQIYSAKTTKYVLESDFVYNRYLRKDTDSSHSIMGAKYIVDTLLNGIHNWNGPLRNGIFYQDLGNTGTPLQPIFYQLPNQIGKTLGFNVYDYYAIDPAKIRYMDTKSPYSTFNYIQSSKGQQILDVSHSRNIRSNWNAGFELKRQVAQKLEGSADPFSSASTRKPQSSLWRFAFYTRYYTKNERYQVLFNFTHLHAINYDYGGVRTSKPDIFLYNQSIVNLYAARKIERRENYHLFHEYSLNEAKTIQIYHVGDWGKRLNRFNELTSTNQAVNILDFRYFYKWTYDKPLATPSDTAKFFNSSNFVMDDRTEYKVLDNKVGLKANLGNLSFNAFVRIKDIYKYKQPSYFDHRDSINNIDKKNVQYPLKKQDSLYTDLSFQEFFVGGNAGYFFRDSSLIKIETEFLYKGNSQNKNPYHPEIAYKTKNDFRFSAEYLFKYLQFGGYYFQYSPSLVQLRYRQNLPSWDNYTVDSNLFNQTKTIRLFGGIKLNNKFFNLDAKVTYDQIKNYIYYDGNGAPRQLPANISFLSPEINFGVHWKFIHMESLAKYTVAKTDTLEKDLVPAFITRTRLYFQSYAFKRAILVQFGGETYFRSNYRGYNYAPVTQQFVLNNAPNALLLKNYPLIDIFLNAQIRHFRIFLKMTHVNQGADKGYYTTPYYPGLGRSFDFGLNWYFYN